MSGTGMVQVSGTTYRISRLRPDLYEIVRILDEAKIGTFRSSPTLVCIDTAMDDRLVREVACCAIRSGKVEWPGLLASA